MEGNIFDYLEWRGDLTFTQSGLNVVDALIFSVLTYINYPVPEEGDILLTDAYALWRDLPEDCKFRGIGMMKEPCMKLAGVIPNYKRFRNVRVTRYVEISSEESAKQFSAMTFILPGKTLFLAFRGTDNTLIGWKEDFNMAFTNGTPAQLEAAAYAKGVAEEFPDRSIEMGGHSKGGNLAVWAAVHLPQEIQRRVLHVYNNDGPGFADNFTDSSAYRQIDNKILSFVPESSIVGVLMGYCDYLTIKSSGVSLMQHHPFTWKIVGKGFVYETERSKSGKKIEKILNGMIYSMDREEYSAFVEDIFNRMTEEDEKTLTDLKKHLLKHVFTTLTGFTRHKMRSEERQKQKELFEEIEKL